MTTARDVVETVREMLGVELQLEHTGGNCAALAGTLETGHALVITDADVLVYSDGIEQIFYGGVSVGIYTYEGWNVEAEDPISDGYVSDDTSADAVRRAIEEAISKLSGQ
jgi:hypothetical protein